MMRKLKFSVFTSFCLIIVILAITTLIDKIKNTEGIADSIYGSASFTMMWIGFTLLATIYIMKRKLWKMPATFLIHSAFLVILSGAFITHLFGEHGSIHIRKGEALNKFTLKSGEISEFPFIVHLDTFQVSYYLGTSTAQDYVSTIIIADDEQKVSGRISMNNIFSYRNYRFYQSGYDPDEQGVILNIAHDPYGITITYTGYLLLLVGMIAFFFQRTSIFRRLLKQKYTTILAILFCATPLQAENMPQIAPTKVAEELSNLYIFHNGRICPLQTYSYDFVTKIHGKPNYRGRNAEEILAGWIFFPDTWKPETMIKIKGQELKRELGTNQKYVSLLDFANKYGEYKLKHLIADINQGKAVKGKADIIAANEKIGIINSVFTSSALKIFPVKHSDGTIKWYSPNDELPDMDIEKWTFIRKSLDLVAENVVMRQYTKATEIIRKIKEYQIKECGTDVLPANYIFKAEKIYNRISSTRIWAMTCIGVGILFFIYFAWLTAQHRQPSKYITRILSIGIIIAWCYLTCCIILRTIISNHLPLANGFETMQALAWICFALTLFIQRKFILALPFGYLIGGFALLVTMIGQSNPSITSLMPVLNSPLLSIHVMVIMTAYALLAFIMLNGIAAMMLSLSRKDMKIEIKRLQRISQLMLYPAVFLLTTGIFIGAVWANISWGRYWGWDTKEVWALITMMIYALPLHQQSISWFRNPKNFHIYSIMAFLTVLMTYFGVNYFLQGLHSYA